jgi:voltage-gated potassium channel
VVNFITMILHKIIILLIIILYLYGACLINANIVNCLFVSISCFALVILLRSYSLFYLALIVLFIISCRYYSRNIKIGPDELLSIFALNLINIFFSLYTLLQLMYYYPLQLTIYKQVSFEKKSMIKVLPVVYMLIIYLVIIVLILAVSKYLSLSSEDGLQFTILKTTAAVISIVILIIVVNGFIYFIIHNFPTNRISGVFDGNLLKDPVKYFYRSAKFFSDCLWFSATTFFTVGYGDMHPVGNIMYMLSVLEMVSAYILGIIIVPILVCRVSSK